jgi:hypothetical protein
LPWRKFKGKAFVYQRRSHLCIFQLFTTPSVANLSATPHLDDPGATKKKDELPRIFALTEIERLPDKQFDPEIVAVWTTRRDRISRALLANLRSVLVLIVFFFILIAGAGA